MEKPNYHLEKRNNFKNEELKTDQLSKKILHKNLFPYSYFACFLCGISGSGKTNLLYNILKYLVIFEETKLIIVSSTIDKDEKMRKIIEKYSKHNEVLTFDHLDDEVYEEIINNISENEEDEKYIYAKTIIIFDDIKQNIRDKKFYDIISKVRHFKSHIFILSQYVKDFTPGVRSNLVYLILLPGFKKKQLEEIYEEFTPACEYEKFERMYHHSNQKPGDCLMCDFKNNEFLKGLSEKYPDNF
jgi:hypothetical protein